ncbi:MAG: sodium:calcium antiporter, partial [Chloroflexi bacterium]|nr:sodium:calcium antiporter [Chloroflexota bacterium]
GIAWPLVVALAFLRFGRWQVELEEGHGLELVVLLLATVYAFVLPLKGDLALFDMAILLAVFGFYVWRLARLPAEHPDLVGPARLIGAMPPLKRRLVTAALAIAAAVAILFVAKPFAKSLVATGVMLGIDEFLLVQWLAPLASEAPEFVVVALFAWRGASTPALGTLISSKINQWTLLVGMLPLVYSISLGRPDVLPLDPRQRGEVLLTAAQSLFAVALLLDLRLSLMGAGVLFSLFTFQLVFPETRMVITIVYGVLTVVTLLASRRHLWRAFRWLGFFGPRG